MKRKANAEFENQNPGDAVLRGLVQLARMNNQAGIQAYVARPEVSHALEQLDINILLNIASYIPLATLVRLCQVSRGFRDICNPDSVAWRNIVANGLNVGTPAQIRRQQRTWAINAFWERRMAKNMPYIDLNEAFERIPPTTMAHDLYRRLIRQLYPTRAGGYSIIYGSQLVGGGVQSLEEPSEDFIESLIQEDTFRDLENWLLRRIHTAWPDRDLVVEERDPILTFIFTSPRGRLHPRVVRFDLSTTRFDDDTNEWYVEDEEGWRLQGMVPVDETNPVAWRVFGRNVPELELYGPPLEFEGYEIDDLKEKVDNLFYANQDNDDDDEMVELLHALFEIQQDQYGLEYGDIIRYAIDYLHGV